jgi:hypothetical protein
VVVQRGVGVRFDVVEIVLVAADGAGLECAARARFDGVSGPGWLRA